MSAAALFIPTTDDGSGSYWVPVSDRILDLDRDKQNAADRVWKAIVSLLPRGNPERTIEMSVTDRMLSQCRCLHGFSERFVQKGLQALESLRLIERIRRRGLRRIRILERLRGHAMPEKPKARQTTRPTIPMKPIPNVPPIEPATPEQIAAAAEAGRTELPEIAAEDAGLTPGEIWKRQKAESAKAKADPSAKPAGSGYPSADRKARSKRLFGVLGLDDPKMAEAMAELAAHKEATHPARE